MATIHSLVRAAMRHAESVQRMSDASHVFDSMGVVHRYAAEVQARADAVEAMLEKSRINAASWAALNWPPPWHLPARALDQIAAAVREKKITTEEVARAFINYYTPDRIEEFRERWAGYAWLGPRLPIFCEALDNYIDGRHYSTVCTLLPQFEGVLREFLGNDVIKENSIGPAGAVGFGSAASQFYAQVIRENYYPDSAAPIPELSRHSILHGKATDYGTAKHSLRIILIADIILGSIEKSREAPAEDE